MTVAGFPHSGITGSQPACGSPMLFAAYHALPRLSVPRHPPCALVRLTGNARSRRPSINRVAPRCTPRSTRFLSAYAVDFVRKQPRHIGRSSPHPIRTHLLHTRRTPRASPFPEGTKAPPGALLDPYFTQPSTQVVKQQPSRRTRERRFATTCDL
jgi:hypothetical protein